MFPSAPKRLRGVSSLWAALFLVWSAANSSPTIEVAAVGLVLTFCVSFILIRTVPIWDELAFSPRKALFFVGFTGVFLREMVLSNLKVMRFTYSPSIKIRPAIVPVRSELTSSFGRFVLSNAVALTPGTLVLWADGQTFYIHVIDLDANEPTDINSHNEAFLGSFEPILARVFG